MSREFLWPWAEVDENFQNFLECDLCGHAGIQISFYVVLDPSFEILENFSEFEFHSSTKIK